MLTSATVPPQLENRLGLPAARTDHLEVGSPFPFETCALLYCAKHLPDPRRPGAREALHEELGSLISAAGGRTLALFTSWRAMHEAADALRPTLPFEVLAQGDKPKAKLARRLLRRTTAPVCSPPCRSGRGWTFPGPRCRS